MAEVGDEKDSRPLPDQIRRPRLTAREKNPRKHQATERKALQTKGTKFRANAEIAIIRHVVFRILPYVKTTSLRLDAHLATNASSDMLRRRRSPARSHKVVRKDQLLTRRSLYNWVVCVFQDSHPRKSILREGGKLASNHTVKFSKGH